MKNLLLIVLMVLTLCACGVRDVRVLELEGGQYTVQVKEDIIIWKWISKSGHTWYGFTKNIVTFPTEEAACAYKENLEGKTKIKRVVKCP